LASAWEVAISACGSDDRRFSSIEEWEHVVETYPAKAQHDFPMSPNPTAMCTLRVFRRPNPQVSLAEDVATPIGAVEAYDFRSLQGERVVALLEMMRRTIDEHS
jgi:hypothetical protein